MTCAALSRKWPAGAAPPHQGFLHHEDEGAGESGATRGPKDVETVILSGLTSQYDGEFLRLKSSSDWLTRE